METHNGGIFHSSQYLLQKLDDVQTHFLKEIDVDMSVAFLDFNFAPPSLRRNIGILGLLHKRVLGLCHPIFQKLLPFFEDAYGYALPGVHTKQLYGHMWEVENQRSLYSRSIFGMVHEYNKLPQNVVDSVSVSSFQTCLTAMARERCRAGDVKWMHVFSCRRL